MDFRTLTNVTKRDVMMQRLEMAETNYLVLQIQVDTIPEQDPQRGMLQANLEAVAQQIEDLQGKIDEVTQQIVEGNNEPVQ